jgi:Bardet-Biedl syndrome 7 protein
MFLVLFLFSFQHYCTTFVFLLLSFVIIVVACFTSAANCIRVDDITGDGVNDLVVARDSGLVQVFSLGEGNDGTGPNCRGEMAFATHGHEWTPTLRVEHEVGESVRSLDVGVVRTPGYDELLLCTYSGRVLSLTTESLSERASDDK